MMNYIDNEEFEIRDGVYVSGSKIMGKDFYIERDGPLGKFFERLFFEGGWERIKNYVGVKDGNIVFVQKNKLEVWEKRDIRYSIERDVGPAVVRTDDEKNYFVVGNYGDRFYIFHPRATLVVDYALKYVEVHEGFRFEIVDMCMSCIKGDLKSAMYGAGVKHYFEEFIRTGGEVRVRLDDIYGECLVGKVEVRGEKKSFVSPLKVCPSEGKFLIGRVPFVEGVYALSVPRGSSVDIDVLSMKELPKTVRKRLVFGPGGRHRVPGGAKRVEFGDDCATVYYDDFELYYREDLFGVRVASMPKWFDYVEWDVVMAIIEADPIGIEVL